MANFIGLKNMFSSIWVGTRPVKIREQGVNMYQFVFANQVDNIRVLNGKACTFDSHFLLLKPCSSEGLNFQKGDFNRITLWV